MRKDPHLQVRHTLPCLFKQTLNPTALFLLCRSLLISVPGVPRVRGPAAVPARGSPRTVQFVRSAARLQLLPVSEGPRNQHVPARRSARRRRSPGPSPGHALLDRILQDSRSLDAVRRVLGSRPGHLLSPHGRRCKLTLLLTR